MAGEEDRSMWLPRPPPPRPARRDAAIEAALRKFDGIEKSTASVPERARPRGWIHRPQAAMLVTATLLVIVGIPATLIGIRDAPQRAQKPGPAMRSGPAAQSSQPAPAAARPHRLRKLPRSRRLPFRPGVSEPAAVSAGVLARQAMPMRIEPADDRGARGPFADDGGCPARATTTTLRAARAPGDGGQREAWPTISS